VITSVHALISSDDPPATRAFLRDLLGWPCVEHPAVKDEGFGFTTFVELPGCDPVMVYQPEHSTAYDL
jgi:catechol 2,3-dioxygenase-like lactoylglutathione lyase family enzyme